MAAQNAKIDVRGDSLPGDAAAIRYEAREAVSRPYEVDVELSTEDASFRAKDCLRNRAIVTLTDDSGGMRHFDGIIDRAAFAYTTGTRLHFRIRLRPTVAALGFREGSRIYQEKSAVDVVKEIFAAAGVDNVAWQLGETYAPREYIVQYRETELAFVQRLLEDEGIFFFFRQTEAGHTMVLADDPGAFAPADDAPEVLFAMSQGFAGQPLSDLARTRRLRTTSVHLRDYDFEKPQQYPEGVLPAEDAWPMPRYEYPGGFTSGDVATRLAKRRISEARAEADTARGSSRAIGLRCGVPFLVEGAAQASLNGEFVVTALRTWGEQTREGAANADPRPTLASGGPNEVCKNEFVAIPKGAPYAPPRATPKPRIRGIQTAIVTGPGAEEQAIHVDKYGRVKVRFYWDRVGQQDDTSSCWLRVLEPPMGGAMFLPRVGWEVAVAFFEGDPDRPFVVGRMYNAEKTPPYALPGTQASGSIKTYSSPGGAACNEIKMGDSGGGQGFDLHAAKDLNITVGNDKNETVGVDETHDVTVNMQVSIGANETIDVGGNQSRDVGAVLSHKIGGAQTIDVGGNETDNATANYVEKVGGDRSYTVGGNFITVSNGVMTDVDGSLSRSVGAAQLTASVATIQDSIGGAVTENVGAVKAEIVKGVSSETIGGSKNLTSLAAELHLVKGSLTSEVTGSVTQMVGGIHYEKVAGDYSVKAPIIAVIGAIGVLKGGGSELKLGGGPVVLKGSKVVITTALLVHLGAGLKLGS